MNHDPRPPHIDLQIDELVLRGVPKRQREAVTEAFRATLAEELGRLPSGTFPSDHQQPRLRPAPVRLLRGTPPGEVGAALARSLLEGLQR
ncbi:MAG: hypothetical protein ACLFR7_10635 [Opitutales bacterium]